MDAKDWDERYAATELVWSAEPNRFVAELISPLSPGTAIDIAAGEGRTRLSDDDVRSALAMADHHHGYSPVLGGASARKRVRLLAQGDLPKLCVWYAKYVRLPDGLVDRRTFAQGPGCQAGA